MGRTGLKRCRPAAAITAISVNQEETRIASCLIGERSRTDGILPQNELLHLSAEQISYEGDTGSRLQKCIDLFLRIVVKRDARTTGGSRRV